LLVHFDGNGLLLPGAARVAFPADRDTPLSGSVRQARLDFLSYGSDPARASSRLSLLVAEVLAEWMFAQMGHF
jgi:hypothetical protein